MTIIDANQLLFAGNDGETITVVCKSANTRHAINAVLDGSPISVNSTGDESSSLNFTLNMAAHDPSHLVMVFQFFNTMGGGMYKVIITGSNGGSSGLVVQQFSSKVTTRIFEFDVV
jgi:hypothetical protein